MIVRTGHPRRVPLLSIAANRHGLVVASGDRLSRQRHCRKPLPGVWIEHQMLQQDSKLKRQQSSSEDPCANTNACQQYERALNLHQVARLYVSSGVLAIAGEMHGE